MCALVALLPLAGNIAFITFWFCAFFCCGNGILSSTGNGQGDQRISRTDLVANTNADGFHLADFRRRNFQGRLIGFHHHDDLLFVELIPHSHVHFNNFCRIDITKIRHLYGFRVTSSLLFRLVHLGTVARRVFLVRLILRLRLGTATLRRVALVICCYRFIFIIAIGLFRLKLHDRITFLDAVTHLDTDCSNFSALGRWHFHRGLVGFQHNNGIFGANGIAYFYADLDDINRITAAHIGNMNLRFTHTLTPYSEITDR